MIPITTPPVAGEPGELQASVLLDAGEPITVVAARLGHRDPATTLRVYAHLMPGADARATQIVGTALNAVRS